MQVSAIVLLGLLIGGCAVSDTVRKTTDTVAKTTDKLVHEVGFTGDGLKKVVAVIGLRQWSEFEKYNFSDRFQKTLSQYLDGDCDDLIVLTPDSPGPASGFTQLPRLPSGDIDNYALTVLGRQFGLNAVVAGSLNDVGLRDEKEGFLWTRETHYKVRVSIRVEAFDTWTGTNIVDENFSRTFEISEMEYRQIQEGFKEFFPDLEETFASLLADIATRICYEISDQLWHGYILSDSGGTLLISSGSGIGLRPGDKLNVFGDGRVIEGVNGHRFFIPGPEVGVVEVVQVEEGTAVAEPVSGSGFESGRAVRKR
jgi:hypothetical protein